MLEKICEMCGDGFVVTRKREEKQRFCNLQCYEAHLVSAGRPERRQPPMEFPCKSCGKTFTMKVSYVREYRKKWGKDPLYCSMPCSDAGRRADADARNTVACKNCGAMFTRKRQAGGTIYRGQVLCSPECSKESFKKSMREARGNKGISRRIRKGYVLLRFPAENGKPAREVLEHRHVMEQHLGRPLRKGETVHHKFGNRQDNVPERLELWVKNHGPGQRVSDQIAFAIEILRLYPEFGREAGVELVDLGQVTEPSSVPALAGLLSEPC